MAYTSSKKIRHGSITVLLTVVVLAIAILGNAIITALAMRYGWFVNMNPTLLYSVTDNCYEFLDTYVVPETQKSGQKIEIIFCDDEDEILADGTQAFIHHTVSELKAAYPDMVEVSYLNVWENPKIARSYGVTASTSVIVKCDDNFRVCKLTDFFMFSASDTSTPLAYNGEKRLAVAMKAVVTHDAPVCYFTLNHGEVFPDYSLMFAVTDAGYTISYLDALSFDIPDNCDLLVTFNPDQDFTDIDGVSGVSEIEKLDTYMQNGGKYMVFISADTFAAGGFANFEKYLSTWGVTFDHATSVAGIEECYAIRDLNHSLTTDGYTLVGKTPAEGTTGGDIMANVNGTIRLSNATSISIADGFTPNNSGDYISGDYTLTPLLTTYAGADAWAGGRAVDRTSDGYNLITLSQNKNNSSSLLVCTSTDFASEAAMQSGVYQNEAFLLTALGAMGKDDTPVKLTSQPFADDTIRTLTTRDARNLTLCLTIIPTALVLLAGTIILIRRKFS